MAAVSPALDGEPFSWGARRGGNTDELRATHVDALRRADGGEIEQLLAFTRS